MDRGTIALIVALLVGFSLLFSVWAVAAYKSHIGIKVSTRLFAENTNPTRSRHVHFEDQRFGLDQAGFHFGDGSSVFTRRRLT